MPHPDDNEDVTQWTERKLIDEVRHELNQAIAIARGLTEVLKDDRIGPLNPKQQEIIGHLERSLGLITMTNEWLGDWKRAHPKPRGDN